jgi:predicted PurR-regulated permease PerM
MQTRDPAAPAPRYGVLIAAIFALLLLAFLYSASGVLLLFFIAALFSLYLGAIIDFLEERFGVARGLGLLAALLVTAVAVTTVTWLIVPPVLMQTQELLAAIPGKMEAWEAAFRAWVARYPILANALPREGDGALSGVVSSAGTYFAGLFPYLFGGLHAVINVISVMVMGVYLAYRPTMYREGVILLAPPVHRELVRDILGDLSRTLRAWIGGQILAMVVLGALTWVGLELLGVPYSLAFGVFTGVVVMVPFFGTLVSTLLPAMFVLGAPDGLFRAFLVILLGLVVHLVEANFIHPLIMERQVNLPPVLSILSVLIMADLLGAVGLVVAVPTLATVMVIVRRIYVHRLLEGKGFRRFVRDAPAEVRIPDGAAQVDPKLAALSIPALLEDAGAAPR